jgi:hypothetical protein
MKAMHDLSYEFDSDCHVAVVGGEPRNCFFVRKKCTTEVKEDDMARDERFLRRKLLLGDGDRSLLVHRSSGWWLFDHFDSVTRENTIFRVCAGPAWPEKLNKLPNE